MGVIWVEVCLISAHGIEHSASLWKRQWFAVGWIDHNSKYCTKVDDSRNPNPVWRTKFAIPVDDSAPNFQNLALNVEVYSLEPIFLTEKLQGSATIVLKEFLVKQVKNSEVSKARHKEVQSYQLRKTKSGKPIGFIDISIRIFEEKKEQNSKTGSKEGMVLLDRGRNTQLTIKGGLEQGYSQQQLQASIHQPENHLQTKTPDYSDPYVREPSYHAAVGPSYHQPSRTRTTLPSSNVGYIPTFLPRNDDLSPGFTDMVRSGAGTRWRGPPGFAVGLGAGALAAGAVIFGDHFISGFDVPPGLGDANLTEEDDPPF
ncbi:hypothetical protein TanjilG_00473 [Lupinus angustifolius]|uniref:C2 domain-containing protein n=1 Tax=Lupinus angustifolius TaxID=3871 RepID=A0A4P1QX58_LUPAN|nr:PREDICTED: uncharacterized protein LOC109328194 [Lupinus angustifolius]OIV96891.1 hypothetical protein TanjilG_00473 [Lupinus angustifolius]